MESITYIILILLVFNLSTKLNKLIKSNEQLKELIGEQSEVIRKIKVEALGVTQIKDLPPGTDIKEIKLKDKKL